jgi:hypothetical protein
MGEVTASRGVRRPDVVPGVSPYLSGDRVRWLNPAAFEIPRAGTFGNLGRNALVGPGFSQLDFTVNKVVALTERNRMEFRAEIFNLLNHANFASPSATLPNSLPGLQPGQAFSPQAAPSFGVITETVGRTVGLGTSRQAQLTIRYSF